MLLHTNESRTLVSALTRFYESQMQAEYDFSGEQRAWHLPRLNDAAIAFISMFPIEAAKALEAAKTPYEK